MVSVVDKPEITASSPSPLLAIDAISSVLSPPENVSDPERLAVDAANSTVPPPLSTILLAVPSLLMASTPPLSTVSLTTAPPLTVTLPWIGRRWRIRQQKRSLYRLLKWSPRHPYHEY